MVGGNLQAAAGMARASALSPSPDWYRKVGGPGEGQHCPPWLVDSAGSSGRSWVRGLGSPLKVIYMARNPKDVLVSFYHFHKLANFLPDPNSFEDFVDEFLEGKGRSWGPQWVWEPPFSCRWLMGQWIYQLSHR